MVVNWRAGEAAGQAGSAHPRRGRANQVLIAEGQNRGRRRCALGRVGRRRPTRLAPALLLFAAVLVAVACTDSPQRPLFGSASAAIRPAMPECPDPGDEPDPFSPDLADTPSVAAGTIPAPSRYPAPARRSTRCRSLFHPAAPGCSQRSRSHRWVNTWPMGTWSREQQHLPEGRRHRRSAGAVEEAGRCQSRASAFAATSAVFANASSAPWFWPCRVGRSFLDLWLGGRESTRKFPQRRAAVWARGPWYEVPRVRRLVLM